MSCVSYFLVAVLAFVLYFVFSSPATISHTSAERENDELFRMFPYSEKYRLSTGQLVDVPWHIFDMRAKVMYGHADLSAVKVALADVKGAENYEPVETADGKAVVQVWAVEYIEGTCGAHNEALTLIVATPNRKHVTDCKSTDPVCIFSTIQTSPIADKVLVMARIYIDSDMARQYAEEVYGTPSQEKVDFEASETRFVAKGKMEVTVAATEPIDIVRTLFEVVKAAGLKKFVRDLFMPKFVTALLAGHAGTSKGYDAAPTLHRTFMYNDPGVQLRAAKPGDKVTLLDSYKSFNFQTTEVQLVPPGSGRFVLLPPFNPTTKQ